MTTADVRLATVLQIYTDDPLDDGDVVLLLDDAACLEVAGLADAWDDQLRRHTAAVLRSADSTIVLAVARRGADLTPGDDAMWRDLHTDLRHASATLLPLKVLPAA